MSFCDQCGTEVRTAAKYCGDCGSPLAEQAASPAAQAAAPSAAAEEVSITWGSTSEDDDLSDYTYASVVDDSVVSWSMLFGLLSGQDTDKSPPLAITWLSQRDEGVIGRYGPTEELAHLLGVFLAGEVPTDGPWRALSVVTPLGHPGLVMVSEGSWPEPGPGASARIVVPVAYGIDPSTRSRHQIRSTLNWLLSKVAAPYMDYVPLVADDSQRDLVLQMMDRRCGTPVPGPLSDPEWLADPDIPVLGSNPQGFPGSPSLRIGILDEHTTERTRPAFRTGQLTEVRLPAGTVDAYIGWQLEVPGFGALGLKMLGHRSLLAIIDALATNPELRDELGGIPVGAAAGGALAHGQDARGVSEAPVAASSIRFVLDGDVILQADVSHGVYRAPLQGSVYATDGSYLFELEGDEGDPSLLVVDERTAVVELLVSFEDSGIRLLPGSLPIVRVEDAPPFNVLQSSTFSGRCLIGPDLPPGNYLLSNWTEPTEQLSLEDLWHAEVLDERFEVVRRFGPEDVDETGCIAMTLTPEDFALQFHGYIRPDDRTPASAEPIAGRQDLVVPAEYLEGLPPETINGVVRVSGSLSDLKREALDEYALNNQLDRLLSTVTEPTREALVNATDTDLLRALARDRLTPAHVLTQLIDGNSKRVVEDIALNPSLSDEDVLRLARHWNYKVRQSLVARTNLPLEALEILCGDRNSFISQTAQERRREDFPKLGADIGQAPMAPPAEPQEGSDQPQRKRWFRAR